MEKLFLPLAIVVVLLSTVVVSAVGQDYMEKNPDRSCVQSRSCAINYMNNLEKKGQE